jgi:mRNA interferase RelE/StbE
MAYSLFILRSAQKELADLSPDNFGRLKSAIRGLAEHPRPHGCLKLTAREGWRIRVGEYRIIYEIDDTQQKVTILHIGHRRDIYS